MTHSSEEALAPDDDYRGRTDDRTAHDPRAAGAILGYGPTELYPLPQTCCVSYSTTETPRKFCSPAALSRARICSNPRPASD